MCKVSIYNFVLKSRIFIFMFLSTFFTKREVLWCKHFFFKEMASQPEQSRYLCWLLWKMLNGAWTNLMYIYYHSLRANFSAFYFATWFINIQFWKRCHIKQDTRYTIHLPKNLIILFISYFCNKDLLVYHIISSNNETRVIRNKK